MDQLPPPKFPQARQWRFNRKRRRSGTETGESESNNPSCDLTFTLLIIRSLPFQPMVKWLKKMTLTEQFLGQFPLQWTPIRNKNIF